MNPDKIGDNPVNYDNVDKLIRPLVRKINSYDKCVKRTMVSCQGHHDHEVEKRSMGYKYPYVVINFQSEDIAHDFLIGVAERFNFEVAKFDEASIKVNSKFYDDNVVANREKLIETVIDTLDNVCPV